MGGAAWTKREVEYAVAALRRSTSVAAAGRLISDGLKRGYIHPTNLEHVFRTHGLEPPRNYLPKRAEPKGLPEVLDPVQEHVRESQERRLRREHKDLVERLQEAEKRQKVLDRLGNPPTPKVVAREKRSGLREATAVALASDWHVEEVVYPEAVAGRNEYNLKVSDRRVREFFRRTSALVEFTRASWKVRDLVLWLGGDLMTGFIHPELAESNELSPVETLIWLRERLVGGIDFLLDELKLERLLVPCSYGNHGRTTEKRRVKTGARNSFEWLLYQWLAAHYEKEKRVTFDASPVAHQYLELYGETAHFTHGDEVKYLGGVGGLSVPLGKRVPRWENVRPSRWHSIGHFHQFLDLGHTVVNGSLIGYSDYAMSIGAEYEPPRQAFFLIDSRRGKCMTAPIWVEKP